ncbi:putative pentatricopeptide repeat-containing protein At5g09950 [Pistacia vera]|uniref:putative pentatricopeptide repeat-containing protein At5g09950 n=1 Tax=Pistacia vera TaxID=55513 RepID=UPI001263B7C1|nr:putative pentatricopeptide repeat-containing protein At5g09950 [Pistacia vera]
MVPERTEIGSFTFATVLSACASVATLERGMEVHACSIRACLESDVVVGSAIIDMYSKCGRIDYASRFFDMMPARNVYSWNSMISGYARHGHGDKALSLFSQMKLNGPLPDHVTFVGVLSACSHAGLVDEGFKHFKSMSQVYGLASRMEHFSCMVDLLGRAGLAGASGRNTELGRKAANMLFEMEPQNAVNYDGVHVFVAGDKSHPEKDLIYEKLMELNQKMRDAGYVPQTKFALFDLDPESKEEVLSYHSEKIAVAFVLTRSSGLPIRIMKNLRVVFAALMSKTEKLEGLSTGILRNFSGLLC